MNNYIVYQHTFPNGRVYIGITKQKAEDRWGENGSRYYKRKQPVIYNAIKEYGWGNITHTILAEGLTKEEAEKMEVELIAKYFATHLECGYNVMAGGVCFPPRRKTKQQPTQLILDHHVIQIDISTGSILWEWESIHQASKQLHVKPLDIHLCCTQPRKYKTCNGFKWKYLI
jgi:hypothetical protein